MIATRSLPACSTAVINRDYRPCRYVCARCGAALVEWRGRIVRRTGPGRYSPWCNAAATQTHVARCYVH